ncbi:unnamed protein product [Caenorhabditis angaria]|uniref:Activin types I and II receptor domain-containing protein n=1 Tax=Caenorhabditis angaria TaxID=860376 RepID=A0A9P1IRW0_9PELO|nr:unnamed protein product [Caenorhabditis angaria]
MPTELTEFLNSQYRYSQCDSRSSRHMRLIWLWKLLLAATIFWSIQQVQGGSEVKCFCDRLNCEDQMLCQGQYCYIGLEKIDDDKPRLRQFCGSSDYVPYLNSHTNCQGNIEGWQEVCKCSEDFCNTFAFLRSSIDSMVDSKDLVAFEKVERKTEAQTPRSHDVVMRAQNSNLIVLLVIIPLSVGGFAVCLIFLNYHCKMC